MPCIPIRGGVACVGNPSEKVTLANGRTLELEWGNYFGPAVVTRSGLRNLRPMEFRDPAIDAWIVKHGGMSIAECDAQDRAHVAVAKMLKAQRRAANTNGSEP